jgi:hypothetical protein
MENSVLALMLILRVLWQNFFVKNIYRGFTMKKGSAAAKVL